MNTKSTRHHTNDMDDVKNDKKSVSDMNVSYQSRTGATTWAKLARCTDCAIGRTRFARRIVVRARQTRVLSAVLRPNRAVKACGTQRGRQVDRARSSYAKAAGGTRNAGTDRGLAGGVADGSGRTIGGSGRACSAVPGGGTNKRQGKESFGKKRHKENKLCRTIHIVYYLITFHVFLTYKYNTYVECLFVWNTHTHTHIHTKVKLANRNELSNHDHLMQSKKEDCNKYPHTNSKKKCY